MDIINEFLKNNVIKTDPLYGKAWRCERLYCKDGFSISIQGSEFHYCRPRSSEAWPYTELELGYPVYANPEDEETVERTIGEYAEDWNEFTYTVFGYVPLEKVIELVNLHGGIK